MMDPSSPTAATATASGTGPRQARQWLKRLGWAGFWFFLIKGLLWLIIPALLVYFGFY